MGDGDQSSQDLGRTFTINASNYMEAGSSVYSQNSKGEWGWHPASATNIVWDWWGGNAPNQSTRIDPEAFCVSFLSGPTNGRWRPPQYDLIHERTKDDYVTIALRDENGGWTHESIMAHYIATELCPDGDTSAFNEALALAGTINKHNPKVDTYRNWQGIGSILDLVDPVMDENGWRIPNSPSGMKGVLEPMIVDPRGGLVEDTGTHTLKSRRAYQWFEITPRPGFDVRLSAGNHGPRRAVPSMPPGQTSYRINDHELGADYVRTGGYFQSGGFSKTGQGAGFGLKFNDEEAGAHRVTPSGEIVPYNNQEYYGVSQVLIPYHSSPRSTGVLTDPFVDDLFEVRLADGTIQDQSTTVKRVQYVESVWGDIVENAPLGFRIDGTPKGIGHHGIITNDEGQLVSELSFDFEADGVEYFGPLIVPSSTPEDITWLANGGEPTSEMYEKAREWTLSQVENGESPFKEGKNSQAMTIRFHQFKEIIKAEVSPEIIMSEGTEGEMGSDERLKSGLDAMAARLLHIKPSEGWYPDEWSMENRMGKHPTVAVLHGFNKVLLDCGFGGNKKLNSTIDALIPGPQGGINWADSGNYSYDLSKLDRSRTGRPLLVMNFESGERQGEDSSNIHLRGNTNLSDPGFFGINYKGQATLHELREADNVTTVETRPDTGNVDITEDNEGDQS